MPSIRLPLFGSLESRDYKSFFDGVTADGAIKYDQGGTDVQYDVLTDNVNGKKVGYFYPRENFATSGIPTTVSADAGTSIHVWTGNANAIISSFGPTNSNVYTASTNLGAVTGQVKFTTEGVISDVANLMMVTTSNKAYFYPSGGAITLINDTHFPTETPALTLTGPMIQKDGYAFVMCTNGRIYNSDLNSLSAYTVDAYNTAQQKPDLGIGIALYQNALAAFSLSSIEFFYNAGTTPSPLAAEANFINLGCANQYAYCNIGDTVAFFSTSNGYGIYTLEGRTAKKISTPPIDRILAGSTATAVRLNPFVSQGRLFLLVTAPVSPGQLAYDIASGTWEFWNMTGNQVTQADVVPNSATSSAVYVGPSVRAYFATSSTGKSGTFLTGKFDAGTNNRKFINSISIISAMGSTSTATVDVSWSDDDYETFTTPITLSVNASERPQRVRSGSFITRAFKVTGANDSSGRVLRCAALEIDYDVGSW